MTMYYLDKEEKEDKLHAQQLARDLNIKSQKEYDILYEPEVKVERKLEKFLEYLNAINSSYKDYLRIVGDLAEFKSGKDKIKYTMRRNKYQKEHDQFYAVLLEPIKNITNTLKYKNSLAEANLSSAKWIFYYILDQKTIKDSFDRRDSAKIIGSIERIKTEFDKIVMPSEESRKQLKEQIKKMDNNKKIISSFINDNVRRELMETLDKAKSLSYEQSDEDKKAMASAEKYRIKDLKIKDNSFITKYTFLSQSTKEEYKIANIDIEKYRKLLLKKELLNNIIEGLKEARNKLAEVSLINEKNQKQVLRVIDLIDSSVLSFIEMRNNIENEIIKIEAQKELIAKAYKVETVLIDELATILFNRKIGISYDQERLDELLAQIKGKDYEKAQAICEEKYREYNNKKAMEEYERRPKFQSTSERERLDYMTIGELEEELRRIGGETAITEAKEHARYEADQVPSKIDQNRLPFDVYDLNIGERNSMFLESYRESLINKITFINSQKEQNKEKAKPEIDYTQALRIITILRSVKPNTRPSDYKLYSIDQYPNYLPNINIKEILEDASAQKEIINFLTAEEKDKALHNLMTRTDEYLDFCIDIGLIKPNEKKKHFKYINEDLYMVALTERALVKCQEIYKDHREELGGISL